MLFRNSPERYAATGIALHWLMLLLLVAVYASMELREAYPKGSEPREALKSLHYVLGLSVLLLVMLRLGLRAFAGAAPAIAPAPARWERATAALMHLALYALMVGMPLLGWALLSAEGKPPSYLGLSLPPLVAEAKGTAELLEEVHEIGAAVGYWLVGLHAAAALFHHYWRHDNTLRRMLPGPAASGGGGRASAAARS